MGAWETTNFHTESYWATAFGFVANLAYKVSAFGKPWLVSGTVYRQPETVNLVELGRIISIRENNGFPSIDNKMAVIRELTKKTPR